MITNRRRKSEEKEKGKNSQLRISSANTKTEVLPQEAVSQGITNFTAEQITAILKTGNYF